VGVTERETEWRMNVLSWYVDVAAKKKNHYEKK